MQLVNSEVEFSLTGQTISKSVNEKQDTSPQHPHHDHMSIYTYVT